MKQRNHYICDSCHCEIPPNAVYAVTQSKLDVWGWYEVLREWHFCPECAQKVEFKYPKLEG